MKKTTIDKSRRLALQQEIVRTLTPGELKSVAGGEPSSQSTGMCGCSRFAPHSANC